MLNSAQILDRYQIAFSMTGVNEDIPSFFSLNLALNALFNAKVSVKKSAELYQEVYQIANQGFNKIILTGTDKPEVITVEPCFEHEDVSDAIHPLTVIPIEDMQAIVSAWNQFVYQQVHRIVEITDGQDIIRILGDDFSNVLVIRKPIAANWPDCHGSIGEYYSVSNHPDLEQKALTQALDQVLISGSNKSVLDQISNLLKLFSNGIYKVSISSIANDCRIYHDKSTFYSEDVKPEERFTCAFYISDNRHKVLFSRSYDSLDQRRIAYYMQLLERGIRPKALVYTHYLHHDHFECPYYIIDGHHKIVAYTRLKIEIPTVFITKDDYGETFDNEIVLAAQAVLKPNEFKHYLANCSNNNIHAFMMPEITSALDDILRHEKRIDTSLHEIIYKSYHSKENTQRQWAEERLEVLSKNKHNGRGLMLYYIVHIPEEKYRTWNRLPINSNVDFSIWKSTYLDDQKLPVHIKTEYEQAQSNSDRQINLTTTTHPRHFYDGSMSIREILLIIALILGALLLIVK